METTELISAIVFTGLVFMFSVFVLSTINDNICTETIDATVTHIDAVGGGGFLSHTSYIYSTTKGQKISSVEYNVGDEINVGCVEGKKGFKQIFMNKQ